MNFRLTLYVLGGLLILLGATLLVPIPVSLWYGDGQTLNFLMSALITALVGSLLFFPFRRRNQQDITLREGFGIVTFAWIATALFGSLPYLFSGSLPHPVDAFFESMSGFATAGASVMTDIEANPKSVLFWRSFTQWIGGMGIIVLGVAILPLLGVGGMQLFQAEAPGPTTDRLKPRIQDTARLLWSVYALVTLGGIGLLWVGEMDLYDATCHTFTAVATGGFSPRNASMGAFDTYSQLVMILVMVAGGASFSLHYHALRGRPGSYWQSDEFRLYIGLLTGLTLIAFIFNWNGYDAILINLRDSTFTVTSILTTTGFATSDYERWPTVVQGLLFAAMFVGACAGSTSGGFKQVRLWLVVKHACLQTSRLLHPRRVRVLKLDNRAVTPDVMQSVMSFAALFVGVFLAGTLLLAATGLDLITAGSGVVACLSTVGPGLGQLGPMDNYAALPCFAKLVLTAVMLLGRLEISTVLVLFFKTFWRK